MKMRASLILIILAIIIGATHATIQFILWANAAGTDLSSGSNSHAAWAFVSFPLFTILPRDVATRFFWIVFGTNSLLWAGCFLFLGRVIGTRLSWLPS
jgi:hypothetical protein